MKAKSLVAVAITLLGLICKQAMLTAAPPIFVLIYIDDLNWTYTSVLMDSRQPNELQSFYETPNIEALALRGMSFSNAYAPASVCTPARKSILIEKEHNQSENFL